MKLPPADPLLVAETIAGLPARLQKRLDAAVSGASGWQYADEVVDLGSAKVTLRPEQGALRRPENVLCDCLLAPGCLHRAAVLSVAPVLEAETPAPEPVESAGSPEGHQVGDRPSDPEVPPLVGAEEDRTGPPTSSIEQPDHPANPWKPTEQAAAQMIWDGAAQLLESGTVGAGAALQGQLLAGVHQARLRALHRLASATTRVVSGIRAARSDDASFSLPSLTADLLEVLAVAHVVISGRGGPDQWRGTARTVYQGVGGLRLAGLCMEPVTSAAGYAGVVVWLTDADGRLWSVSDVKPGDAERIPASASGPVAVGETGLSHRELTRAGMIMASATANPDGRLGSGNAVRAVRAAGVAWTEPQLAVRFGPLNGQAAEANSARPASARVPRLLSLTVCGSERDAILAVDDAGEGVRLVVPGGDHRQVHRENLRLLAEKPGLRMLAVARPRPDDVNGSAAPARFLGLPATLELIAIGVVICGCRPP